MGPLWPDEGTLSHSPVFEYNQLNKMNSFTVVSKN